MKKYSVYSLFLFLLFQSSVLYSQVTNDNASQAQSLSVNDLPYKSDTKNCTLEDSCIDRKLTAKCLVYHNDQWFSFTTGKESVYYLSIRNQDCRDVNGVQLQVIEGHLCKPSSYRILECISLSTQDDIYLTLTNLKKNHTYILNVDGYLHDFCKFEIGITTTLPDFAVQPLSHLQDLNGIQKNGKVFLEWKLSEELESVKTETFEIRRRFEQEKKLTIIASMAVERSVHGQFKTEYQYIDSVGRKGYYHYQVIAIAADSSKHLVGQFTVFSNPIVRDIYETPLELPCKDKTPLTISIYNWESNFLLSKMSIQYYNGISTLGLGSFFQPGMMRLKVVVADEDGKKIKEFLVDRKY